MKFSAWSWDERKPNVWHDRLPGSLRVTASSPGALYVRQLGVEVCAGYGAQFDLKLSDAYEWMFDPGKGAARVFEDMTSEEIVQPTGEVFTNVDRMPSGHWDEIARLRRELELSRYQERRAAMAATAEMAMRMKADEAKAVPPNATASDPVPPALPMVEPPLVGGSNV